jgi:predicted dehydrogenase
MVKVGFIGCGRIADLHWRGYVNNPDAMLYAICDADPDCLARRQSEWGTPKTYTEYRALLDDPEINAVEVLVPYDKHEEVVCAAAAAGKHIACQKPVSTDLASADRMAAATKKAGVLYKITEIYTTYPPIRRAKELIEAGAIGEPVGMRINFLSGARGGWAVGSQTHAQQLRIAARGLGMQTFDHGHHEWATAWYLLGDPDCVSAWIVSKNGVIDDTATAMWTCKQGQRHGIIDYHMSPDLMIPTKYYPNDEIYQVVGTKGVIFIHRGTGEMMDRAPVSLFDNDGWHHFDELEGDCGLGFVESTKNFIRAIRGEEAPLLNPTEARTVLRFGLAMMKSARERREVYVDELDLRLPRLHAWRRRRQSKKECAVRPQRIPFFGVNYAQYAGRATEMTVALAERFDPQAAGDWECRMVLHLSGEDGVGEDVIGIDIGDGLIKVTPGELPMDPHLTLWIRAGVWGAILCGKKRIETAVLQGLIKYEGEAERALPLRKALRL